MKLIDDIEFVCGHCQGTETDVRGRASGSADTLDFRSRKIFGADVEDWGFAFCANCGASHAIAAGVEPHGGDAIKLLHAPK